MRTHLSCDVRCAMGSRWVESQCWLSLHWAPRGVFIVAKINKATVTKRPSPSQIQAQGYVRGHVRTCARAHSGASWQHTKSKEEEQKKKKAKTKGLTHAHKVTKAHEKHSRFDTQRQEHSWTMFWVGHPHTHTHPTSSHAQSQSKKENNLGKLGGKKHG